MTHTAIIEDETGETVEVGAPTAETLDEVVADVLGITAAEQYDENGEAQ